MEPKIVVEADPTLVFNFEYTRVCNGCGKEKTLTYFGRRSLEMWVQIAQAELQSPHLCEACRNVNE